MEKLKDKYAVYRYKIGYSYGFTDYTYFIVTKYDLEGWESLKEYLRHYEEDLIRANEYGHYRSCKIQKVSSPRIIEEQRIKYMDSIKRKIKSLNKTLKLLREH